MELIYFIPAASVIGMVAGFIAGKYHERIEWNKKVLNGSIQLP